MLDILYERGYPSSQLVAIASERSAGRELPYGSGALLVEPLSAGLFGKGDFVLLDTPDDVARQWGPQVAEAGALAIDNSAAWRMQPDVPLVVPEVNPEAARANSGIIASPNCTTIGVVVPAAALHRQFGLRKMIVSSYQATSGAGQAGVDALHWETAQFAEQGDDWKGPASECFPAPIAGNLIPRIGSESDDGYTSEELKMLRESRKIMGLEDLEVVCTCVRVPTVTGHGASVWAEFEEPVRLDAAEKALREAPGVQWSDLPNPLAAAGTDPCYVGRLRPDPFNPRALTFFTVSDNLRKGAALNTVQIAELLFS